jgi:TRAP-type uncharacterized transport system fused permease subunit
MTHAHKYEPPQVVDHLPDQYAYRWMGVIARNWRVLLPLAVLIVILVSMALCQTTSVSFDGPITH